MKLDFEYGQGTMAAELPDNTDIFIPGEKMCIRDRCRVGNVWNQSKCDCTGMD